MICTWNNCSRLNKTLKNVEKINVTGGIDWEVVVVDNKSTDNTKDVVQSFEGDLPIKYSYEPEQGLAKAHNAGMEVVRGDLILFTDDDVKPDPNWLMSYWEAYQERPEEYYFGGPIISEYEGEPPDDDLMRVAIPSVIGLDLGTTPHEVSSPKFIGPNWACPRKHLERAGKFDEQLGLNPASEGVGVGEETDMMSRLGALGIRGWYVPGAKIEHFVPESKCTLRHVSSRVTSGYKKIYEKNQKEPLKILGIPLGLYKGYYLSYLNWILRKSFGLMWKKEYVEWVKQQKMLKSYTNS